MRIISRCTILAPTIYLVFSVLLLPCIARVPTAAAENFRVATRIFIDDEETPVSQTITLFSDGVVYDFLESARQTAIFRGASAHNPARFILLDDARRIRTEISTDKLTGAIDKLSDWARRQSDPFLKFAADPNFDETFEPESNELILASHVETYTVTTAPALHANALDQYRNFLDWYAKLNTLLGGSPPPTPRLKLNDALARREVIPLVVRLNRAGEDSLRAEHDFTWRLSQQDAKRIDQARAALASYRQVDNETFLHRAE